MQNFHLIAKNVNVSTALAQVEQHPELWNQHAGRTASTSPHFGVDDIWVRYREPLELARAENRNEPHFSVFYPAWRAIPALEDIVFDLMAAVRPRATMLGGILITRIPPGGQVKPHHDRGGWHAEFYNTKIYVPLKSNAACVNHCEGEQRVIRAGEAVTFDNLRMHSVVNGGETERITLIVCLRTEP